MQSLSEVALIERPRLGAPFAPDPGSFRDRSNRVFLAANRVLRGLSAEAACDWELLSRQVFFRELLQTGAIVGTRALDRGDPLCEAVPPQWRSLVLEHDRVPFISYPYEWTFSMLKDAALLQLHLLRSCLAHGWSMKDASAYNIQWRGARPVFIDVGSFEPAAEGEAWIGYRQFCMHFLIPLLLKAHRDIDVAPLLRANLEGIAASEAIKFFPRWQRLKRGVLAHIAFPAAMEARIAKAERDAAPAKRRAIHHSQAMLLGLATGLERTIKRLDIELEHTAWSHYENFNTYDAAALAEKKQFVERWVCRRHWPTVWDIGCNTGTFSRLCSSYSDLVVSIDSEHNAVEKLYRREKEAGGSKILPVVMDLANPSPGQGWNGAERKAFDGRTKPDLIVCLALVHHIVISANVPISSFIQWLGRFNACVIIEFVTREDEMVQKLLMNKKEKHQDYDLESFAASLAATFKVIDSKPLKGGRRQIFYLEPN
ncbi:MAG: hypothetical protein K8F92_19150 [Hyphomicrobium sp.]|uniref:hypothetical protein n=1 Tax=Hyphomicrobium sp. TaxID=82 RepID=UPI00132A7257|nr:hypothetical protein [Hyphomicrobium sp.]KAB2939021.1 MAG: methyltransferase [Hyphomicrobium sp.]MBZ0211750.1 hypothetical protein [Hyphomicrobium sp.]